mmetsp:Transcript_23986/g.60704  ORF Transcript_23986/g.60704 Transcript_23986/m.60704 type:complete len:263 (-) Transcript_23986:13-801(-)
MPTSVMGVELDVNQNEILIGVGSFVFHLIFFYILPGKSDDSHKLKSCYLSHFHCIVILISCLAYWATMPVDLYSAQFMIVGPDEEWKSQWMRLTVCFSLGYFMNDLILILMHPSVGGADMLVHHIVIGVFFTSGILDRCCTPYHFLFMIEELSTPFLNLRFQYKEQKESSVYFMSQAAFVILFFLSRIVVGTGFVWVNGMFALQGYLDAQPSEFKRYHIMAQMGACSFSRVLNFWWMWKIVKIVVRSGGKIKTTYVNEDKID